MSNSNLLKKEPEPTIFINNKLVPKEIKSPIRRQKGSKEANMITVGQTIKKDLLRQSAPETDYLKTASDFDERAHKKIKNEVYVHANLRSIHAAD